MREQRYIVLLYLVRRYYITLAFNCTSGTFCFVDMIIGNVLVWSLHLYDPFWSENIVHMILRPGIFWIVNMGNIWVNTVQSADMVMARFCSQIWNVMVRSNDRGKFWLADMACFYSQIWHVLVSSTDYTDWSSRPIVSRHSMIRFHVMFFDWHLTATCCIQGLNFTTFKEVLQF